MAAEDTSSPPRRRRGQPASPPTCPPGWRLGPPDFVGVGVQRAGTTWWWSLLTAHPGVHAPEDGSPRYKERHFFSRAHASADRARGKSDYSRHFPRPPGQITGEWTPRYMYDPATPRALAAAAPNAQLLLMLRDPVERYRSALGLIARQRDDGEIRRGKIADAVSRGMYLGQLSLLLSHFAPSQVLVLQYERCVGEPREQLARTFAFLGLDPGAVPASAVPPRRRKGLDDKPQLDPETRADLVARFRPEVEALATAHPEIDLDLWPNFAAR